MKSLEGWRQSEHRDLDSYLQIGDVVAESMVQHFADLLPPVTFTGRRVQIGEPHDHVKGKPRFGTFEVVQGQWTWQGNQFKSR